MFTIKYKGLYINGYIDKPECRVVFPHGCEVIPHKFKSLHSAKMFITKILKYQNATN